MSKSREMVRYITNPPNKYYMVSRNFKHKMWGVKCLLNYPNKVGGIKNKT